MPDYSKAVIYKIVCNQTGEIYIGATIRPLAMRFAQHKWEAKPETIIKSKCVSKQILNRGDCCIELVEEYPCATAIELHQREREWIERTDCINKAIPFRTEEEKKAIKKKINDIRNPIYNALPPIQCECGRTYTYKHKTKHFRTVVHRLETDEDFRKEWEVEQTLKNEVAKVRLIQSKLKNQSI